MLDCNTSYREKKQRQREGGLERESTVLNMAHREGFITEDTIEEALEVVGIIGIPREVCLGQREEDAWHVPRAERSQCARSGNPRCRAVGGEEKEALGPKRQIC